MAESNIYYEDQNTGEALCFVCATKRAVASNPASKPRVQIEIRSTDYPHTQCIGCETFIGDKVTI